MELVQEELDPTEEKQRLERDIAAQLELVGRLVATRCDGGATDEEIAAAQEELSFLEGGLAA